MGGFSLLSAARVGIARLPALQRRSLLSIKRRKETAKHVRRKDRGNEIARWFDEVYTGENATLDDDGYQDVVELASDTEMEIYIRRMIKALHYEITDMGGLHGVVPYYSGTHVAQSFKNLVKDLKRGLKRHGKYGAWLKDPNAK